MGQQIDVPGTGIVEFPDSMSDQDIVKAIQTRIMPQQQYDDQVQAHLGKVFSDPGILSGQFFGQGATLGFADEAQAAMLAMEAKMHGDQRPFSSLYGTYHGMINELLGAAKAAHPIASKLDAGIGTAATAMATPARLLMAGPGTGLAARMAGGAAGGAVLGGAQGAGDAPTAAQVPDDMVRGAAAGSLVGAALPPSLDAAGAALVAPVRALYRAAMGSAAPASAAPAASGGATDAILGAIQADNTSPGALAQALRAAAAGGKPVMPADLGTPGGNLQGLVRQTVTLPGPGRAITTSALNDRSAVPAALPRALGDAATMAGNPTQAQASAAYDAVMPQELASTADLQAPVGSRLLEMLRQYGPFRDAHSAYYTGEPLPAGIDTSGMNLRALPSPLYDAQGALARPPTVQDVDMIKRVLDPVSERLGKGDFEINERPNLERMAEMRKALVGEADAQVPGYADARGIAQRLARLGDVNDTLTRAADTSVYPNLGKAVGGTSDMGAKAGDLIAQFGDTQAARFLQEMETERQMLATRNTVLGNSNTAQKEAESGLLTPADLANAVTSPKGAILRAIEAGYNSVRGRMLAGRNTQIARGMTSTGDQAQAFLDQLDRVYRARMASQVGRNAPVSATLTGAAATGASSGGP